MKQEAKQLFWRDKKLPYIEARSAYNSKACYEKHTHPSLSIGIIEAGLSQYQYQRMNKTIGSGSIVIIDPEEIHACNPKSHEPWAYKMLNIDPIWLTNLKGEINRGIVKYGYFNQAYLEDPLVYESIRSLYALLLSSTELLEKETQIIRFFSVLFSRYGDIPFQSLKAKDNRKLKLARHYIADNCTSKLSIDQISAASNLSHYYLIRAFKQAYGLTPHAFQIDQRINLSKKMLKSGMSLAEVAFSVGFSDQSHFHRCFKKRVAATPRQYQNSFIT